MKYYINVNQAVLSETNLDLLDCAILDYIYFICSSPNAKIERARIYNENGAWTWVNYQQMLREMPLLRIKTAGALSPRVKRIEENGYIKIYRPNNQKLYIQLTEKIDELFTKLNSSIHETKQPFKQKLFSLMNRYNSIDKNIDNTKNIDITIKPPISPLACGFDTFWKEYPRKIAKPNALKAYKQLKVDDKLLKAILAGLAKWQETDQWQKDKGRFIPHPATFLNQRRWEDELEADEEVKIPEYAKNFKK
jgi:DNA-binding MarR family transcriptional regulator